MMSPDERETSFRNDAWQMSLKLHHMNKHGVRNEHILQVLDKAALKWYNAWTKSNTGR